MVEFQGIVFELIATRRILEKSAKCCTIYIILALHSPLKIYRFRSLPMSYTAFWSVVPYGFGDCYMSL